MRHVVLSLAGGANRAPLRIVGVLLLCLGPWACGETSDLDPTDAAIMDLDAAADDADRGVALDAAVDDADRGVDDLEAADLTVDKGLCGGKVCDDGIDCTDDLCLASGCVHQPKPGACLIDKTCYKDGEANTAAACQICSPASSQTAWTDDARRCVDDGIACTDATCNAGKCSHLPMKGYCVIGGTCVSDKTVSSANECQFCDAATLATAYSNQADGTACTNDKLSCTGDTCQKGVCAHTLSKGFCIIGGKCVAENGSNPLKDCQICSSTQSSTVWSTAADGAKCTNDGLTCTNDTCQKGVCQHPIKTGHCLIDGSCYKAGTARPGKECQTCIPASSTTRWTHKGDGIACTADSLNCTSDTCQKGICTHRLKSGTCFIGGACRKDSERNPSNPCRGCVPTQNPSNWSNLADGTQCTADLYACTQDTCTGGICKHPLLKDFCLIGNTCFAKGSKHSVNPCLSCDPAGSAGTTNWSVLVDGAACTSDGVSCTNDICQKGICAHKPKAGTCLIDGQCYSSGVNQPGNSCRICDPSSSTNSWTARADNVSCASDGLNCTTDVCQKGICTHSVLSGNCLVTSQCYAAGASEPFNPCNFCNPTQGQYTWTPRAAGYGCNGGTCVAGGICCKGCISAGLCRTGDTDGACGGGGLGCKVCAAGTTCSKGLCVSEGCRTRGTAATCNGCDCQACVCAIDRACCDTTWDGNCVTLCKSKCGGYCP